MNIPINRNPNPGEKPTGTLGFGQYFTPHMFKFDYCDGQWKNPRIEPNAPLRLHPAAKVLHYGQEIFEGMKAYTNPVDGKVHMFRPEKNIERFNNSCHRMCMPPVDPDVFMKALDLLVDLDRDWVPKSPEALYIRPTLIATTPTLGVVAASEYLFYIIVGPVGNYFAGGIKPLRLKAEQEFVRSAPGGTGFAKTGGNYAAALLPIKQAQDAGFDQIIWLDAVTRQKVEEMGAMNIAFVYEDKIVTAPTGDTILAGVTRDSVGVLCKDFGYNWVEKSPVITEVCADADNGTLKEVLACGTAAVVTPVGVINYDGVDHQIGNGAEGSVTEKLRVTLCGIHEGNHELHPEWIHHVPGKD